MRVYERTLRKLADWSPDEGRQILAVPDEGTGWSVAITADRSDVLGSLVWELSLQNTKGSMALEAWVHRAARATGLLEPLKVVEIDRLRNEALLRSARATERDDTLLFHEILLRGSGSALVRRIRTGRQADAKREQVVFAMTHEALAKLADDLTATE